MWVIYSLIGALITGVGQVLVKKGQIELSPLLDNFFAAVIVNVILVPLLIFLGVDFSAWQSVLFYAIITAVMYGIFYYVISFNNVSIMISLVNTFPIITIILAVVFLHEWPNFYQWIGIIFIMTGILCISKEKVGKSHKTKSKSWLLWGLLGACAIGIAEFVTELATMNVDGFTFTFFVYLMYIPTVLLLFILDKKGRKVNKLKNRSSIIYTFFGILFIEGGLISISLAYQHGLASVVSPVVATHSLITVVLAVLFLKEKLYRIQKVGVIMNLLGVFIIGIWS